MKRIYKYQLEPTDYQTLDLPIGFKILTVAAQNGIICIWVLIDSLQEVEETIDVYVYGTGHPINKDDIEYIGTAFLNPLVFHVFYKKLIK